MPAHVRMGSGVFRDDLDDPSLLLLLPFPASSAAAAASVHAVSSQLGAHPRPPMSALNSAHHSDFASAYDHSQQQQQQPHQGFSSLLVGGVVNGGGRVHALSDPEQRSDSGDFSSPRKPHPHRNQRRQQHPHTHRQREKLARAHDSQRAIDSISLRDGNT